MDGPWGKETAAQLQRLVDQVGADDSEGAQQVQVPDRDGTAGAVQLKGLTLPFSLPLATQAAVGIIGSRDQHLLRFVAAGRCLNRAYLSTQRVIEYVSTTGGHGQSWLCLEVGDKVQRLLSHVTDKEPITRIEDIILTVRQNVEQARTALSS